MAVALVATHALVFVGGTATGRYLTMGFVLKEVEKADAEVVLGHYTIYRDIAKALRMAKHDDALCSAELAASSMFDDVKECMTKQECANAITKTSERSAPEVLTQSKPVDFHYLPSQDGIRRCSSRDERTRE